MSPEAAALADAVATADATLSSPPRALTLDDADAAEDPGTMRSAEKVPREEALIVAEPRSTPLATAVAAVVAATLPFAVRTRRELQSLDEAAVASAEPLWIRSLVALVLEVA